MKYIFTTLFSLACFTTSFSQCPSFNVDLDNQAEVDAFVANFPNCQNIVGSLTIGHFSFSQPDTDINDITGLSSIQTVGGEVLVGNTLITSLDGFDNLTTIGSDFSIIQNDFLQNVNDISSLTTVGGEVDISSNPLLASLSGFSSINSIGGDLGIKFLDALIDITGFSQVTNIPGDIFVLDCPLLTDLEGLHNIQSVNAGNGVSIEDTGITDFFGLRSLHTINGIFGSLAIRDNPDLTSLNGLQQLTFIDDGLFIDNSPLLTDISALSNVNHIAGHFRARNIGVSDFSGMQNAQLSGYVWLQNNSNLVSLNGLSFDPVIVDYFSILSNPLLSDITAMSSIDSIYGGFSDGLEIGFNPALQDLSGLENLVWIGDDLDISWNASLSDISALSNLNTIDEDLRLTNNTLLSDCSPICELVQSGVGGIRSISSNLTGCNSVSEITVNFCLPPPCIVTIDPLYTYQIINPGCSTGDIFPQDLLNFMSDCSLSTFVFFDGVNEVPSISFDCSQLGIHTVEIIIDDFDFYYTDIEVRDDAMSCNQTNNYILTGPTTGDEFYGVSDFIQSDQQVICPHDIHYDAGNFILLEPSFEVFLGSQFQATIGTSGCN